MTIFLESPWPVILMGIVAEAVLAVVLVTTRRGLLLGAMGGVLVVVLLGVALEILVVTEREQVERTLDGIIASLNANDLNRLLEDYVAPDARTTRARAAWALNRVEIQQAKYHNLRVTINRLTSPPTALAEFYGVVFYRDRKGEIPHEYYSAQFAAEFELRDGRWMVTDHVEYDVYGVQHQDDQF